MVYIISETILEEKEVEGCLSLTCLLGVNVILGTVNLDYDLGNKGHK